MITLTHTGVAAWMEFRPDALTLPAHCADDWASAE